MFALRATLHRATGGLVRAPAPIVAVLRLEGVIAPGRRAGALNLQGLSAAIDRAFKLRGLAAVALVVNSPGGAPAQSALIHSRIRERAEEHGIPVLAFAEDVAASGGYWLALAGDEIWAQETSLLGSIGVVTAAFGFQDLIARLGIERRIHTAGESKTMLDPFQPERPDEVARLETLQRDIHDSFKALVRARRGSRLNQRDDLFTGAVFTGRQALERGLVDGIGGIDGVLRSRFGARVRLRALTPKPRGWLARRLVGGDALAAMPTAAADIAAALLDRIEERLLWSRFGL